MARPGGPSQAAPYLQCRVVRDGRVAEHGSEVKDLDAARDADARKELVVAVEIDGAGLQQAERATGGWVGGHTPKTMMGKSSAKIRERKIGGI